MDQSWEKIRNELEEIEDWALGLATKAEKARKLIEGEMQCSPGNQRASEIRKTMLRDRMSSIFKKSPL